MPTLTGTEVASSVKRSQVFLATHDGEGNALPFMNRSFISFTYGGKKIEEFDLIATISGDRLNKPGYASFEDTITTYDNLDGQHYWATHYKTNQLDFTLSTDGIDEKKLNEFLYWFKAGVHRELILAEHPNRGIMARVANPPTINMIPFEQDVEITISSNKYKTKTTLYKGDISLSLVMDQPHWYGLTNLLGKKTQIAGRWRYEDVWTDITKTPAREISIFASQDALKILYEDGIPLGSMINKNMLLGNGAYASVENQTISLTWSKLEGAEDFASGEGARIDSGNGAKGIIAGAIVDATDNGITSLASGVSAYFFYSGTAPSPTIITFTMTPTIGSSGYITVPKNSHSSPGYNTFTIESLHKQELRLTTPNIYTSFNKCIEIFNSISSANTWEDIRAKLRDQVRHPKARAWAIQCIACEAAKNATIPNSVSSIKDNLKTYMSYFLKSKDENNPIFPVTFSFNSETGEALGTFSYRTVSTTADENTVWNTFGDESKNQVEDVGDMLKSNYIIIQDRNYPTNNGKIENWMSTNDTTKQYSHRIKHDISGGLTNVQILYKNMYL